MDSRSNLLEKLLRPVAPFTTSDFSKKALNGEISIALIDKNMKKIKDECEKLFPKFLDIGYKMKKATFIPSNNFAIFNCGQALMGRIDLEEMTINNVFIKDLGDIYVKNFHIDLERQKIYVFGVCKSKKSSSLYALFEVENPGFSISRRHDLNEPIHHFFLNIIEHKLFVLFDSSISSLKIEKNEGLQIPKVELDGNFRCFDYAEEEWVVSDNHGMIKTFSNYFQPIAQIDLGTCVHRVRFSKGKKNVLVITDFKLIKFSNNFHKKVVFEIDSQPVDAYLNQINGNIYVSTQDGKIVVISQQSDQKLVIPIHNNSIVHFRIDELNEKIITFAEDSKIGVIDFPQLIETYKLRKQVTNLIFCGDSNDLVYIDSNKFLIKWALNKNQFETIFETDTVLSKCLKYFRPKSLILFSDENWIYLMHYESKEIVKRIKLAANVDITHAIFSEDGETIFTVVSQNNIIFCTNLYSQERPKLLNGHDGCINSLVYIKTQTEKILISGADDCKIFIWDIEKSYEKISILEGHKAPVTCLALDKESHVISGSKDFSIKVWDWRNQVLIVSMTGHSSPIIKVRVDHLNYIHSVSSDGMIVCWNPLAYVRVFTFTLKTQISDMVLIHDGQLAAITDIESIKLMELQLSKNAFDVIGFDSEFKYEYVYYLSKILKGEAVEYDPKWDDWAVLPYQYNTLQFYCYANLYKHLKLSICNGAFLVPSPTSEPFSIVTYKRLNRSLKSIFKATSILLERNPNSLCFVSHNVIIELNRLGHSHLATFYNEFFWLYSKDDFPKFMNKDYLPRVVCSKSIYPSYDQFFKDLGTIHNNNKEMSLNQSITKNPELEFNAIERNSFDEVPISLYVSAIGLYLDNGSSESIELLMSIIQCSNKEIFKTKYIQTLLDLKWSQLKVYQIIQAVAYFIYLINLSIYLTMFYQRNSSVVSNRDNELFAFIVVISIGGLLSFYDLWKLFKDYNLFWKNVWNYFDLARLLSLIIYSYCFFADFEIDSQDEIMIVITFISFIRGISFFRIFNDTRYLIQLIQNVILDIKSFSIILTYSTFSFSIIQVVQEGNNLGYLNHLKEAFMVNLGDLNIDENKTGFTWIILALMGVLNLLILLNMLISIMGDTFSRTKENSEIANYEQITLMILETETVLLKKTLKPEKTFLQLCEADTSAAQSVDVIQYMKKIKEYFKEINQSLQKLK